METRQINNPELIREFMTQPKLYDRMTEDHSVEADSWAPNLILSLWVMAYEIQDQELDIAGMFAFVPETPILYQFYPAINPEYWGHKHTVEAGKLAVQWLWDNTAAQKIITKAPVLYPDALKWAQRVGFKREGIQRQSFLKHQELHDQYYIGISREQ